MSIGILQYNQISFAIYVPVRHILILLVQEKLGIEFWFFTRDLLDIGQSCI